MKVEIEEILKLKERLKEINSENLSEITFTLNGEDVEIDPKNINEFRFVGLSNVDFITSEFYKYGFDEENLD